MPKTMYEKIVEANRAGTLSDGSNVLNLGFVWCHEITTPNAIIDMKGRGCNLVFDPNRIKAMIDHVSPAKDTLSAIQGKMIREWGRENRIEFLDVGRNGVCHAVIPESGWVQPGKVGIIGDSHGCTHGAFGMLAAGVGTTELEAGLLTGLWVCPPQKVIRINVTGKLPANVFSKDIILEVIRMLGVKGGTNCILEFGGPVIARMSMDARMTLTNMAVEAGATSGMIGIDRTAIEYLRPVLPEVEEFDSDPGCEYHRFVELDVTGMKPKVTFGFSPENVVDVGELATKTDGNICVNQVFIGSCTNGRIEDLRIAAEVFRSVGKPVADGVRCIVIPATRHVWQVADEEGLLRVFMDAGCCVSNPSCGACLGMSCGVLAPREVCVSTSNRNFPGRMGEGGMVHLASPATAAMTAMEGVVTEAGVNIHFSGCDHPSIREQVQPTGWKPVSPTNLDYRRLLNDATAKQVGFSGKAFCLPKDDVDTDQIIPAYHLTATDKKVFGQHCLEGAGLDAYDKQALSDSRILVAGKNFGCGSSREHAVWALEQTGISCVIAPSFARIFFNNMFSNGLLCVTLKEEEVKWLMENKPERLEVDLEGREVRAGEKKFKFALTEFQKRLIKSGGLINVMLKVAADAQ